MDLPLQPFTLEKKLQLRQLLFDDLRHYVAQKNRLQLWEPKVMDPNNAAWTLCTEIGRDFVDDKIYGPIPSKNHFIHSE